jgi:hypothetical protein
MTLIVGQIALTEPSTFTIGLKMNAPELLKRQMPTVREIESICEFYGYYKGTPEWKEMFDYWILFYRKFVGEVK